MKLINVFLMLLSGSLMLPMMTYAAVSDVDFKGILVAEPCNVATGDDGDNVVVDFGAIPDKNFYFYSPPRTWLQTFHILLQDCDLSLGSQVKLTFTGTDDSEQPGRLAISSSTGVSHVAVGIQDVSGKDIAINKPGRTYQLNAGTTELKFKTYIQASSSGIKNRSVGTGNFEAITTFILDYP